MKIYTAEEMPQGSDLWLNARAGRVTCSELNQLLTDKWEPRTGEMPRTYMYRKLAEKWLGRPMQSFGGGVLEQGSLSENSALARYELEFDAKMERVGFIATDDGRVGCSPDGLVGDGIGVEAKCPQPPQHVGWLLKNELPPVHAPQVYGGMWVTGFDSWLFLSYSPGFPLLVKTVKRDEEIMDAIGAAVEDFYVKFNAAWEELCRWNGGPPRNSRERLKAAFSEMYGNQAEEALSEEYK